MDLQESYSNDFISQDQPDESVKYHKPGAAITSMVLGICSVSLWFYPFVTGSSASSSPSCSRYSGPR